MSYANRRRNYNIKNYNHNNQSKNNENNRNHDEDMFKNLLQNKSPEIAIIALILSGKLKFDSVGLFRQAALTVTLVGTFNKTDEDKDRVDEIVEFLDENGDMTVDEIFQAIKKKTED